MLLLPPPPPPPLLLFQLDTTESIGRVSRRWRGKWPRKGGYPSNKYNSLINESVTV
jgi:hypothetical protein